jgi:nitrite reductase (NO-forming)
MGTAVAPPGTAQPVTGPDDSAARGQHEARRYLAVRIGFGLIWAIDATLKWLPGFRGGFLGMIQEAAVGQPSWLAPWFRFWESAIAPQPVLFAVLTAVAETAVCLSLLLGVAQRAGFVLGGVMGVMIWGIGEGFGGPYGMGSTDIGCAIMYTVVFAGLVLAVPRRIRAAAPSMDARLVRRWPWLAPLTFIRRPAA